MLVEGGRCCEYESMVLGCSCGATLARFVRERANMKLVRALGERLVEVGIVDCRGGRCGLVKDGWDVGYVEVGSGWLGL